MVRFRSPLLLLAAFSTPAFAGGFQIQGDELETVKLVFDSKGVDRSTAEGTARGLLEMMISVRSPALELKFESIALKLSKRGLQPLLTSESYNDLLGKQEEKLRAGSGKGKASITSDVQFTDTSSAAGLTTIRYLMTLKIKSPCNKCAEKADPSCSRCKGTGLRERNRKVKGAVVLKQKDTLWLVAGLKSVCYGCEGTGKQTHRMKADVPPHKCTGAACATCGVDPAGKSCSTCSGTGLRDDKFLQGPRKVEGLPTFDTKKPDLTSPEKAFASFGVALQARQVSQQALQGQLALGFRDFATFFCHPDHMPKQRVKKVTVREYKVLEVHKGGDERVNINYAVVHSGSSPDAATKVAGKAELRKGGDGNWRVSKLLIPCWSCSYQRKRDPAYQCQKCANTGFQKADYLP